MKSIILSAALLTGCGTMTAASSAFNSMDGYRTTAKRTVGKQPLPADGNAFQAIDARASSGGIDFLVQQRDTCIIETYWKDAQTASYSDPAELFDLFGAGPVGGSLLATGVDVALGGLAVGILASAAHYKLDQTPEGWNNQKKLALQITGGVVAVDAATLLFATSRFKRTHKRTTTDRGPCSDWVNGRTKQSLAANWVNAPDFPTPLLPREEESRHQISDKTLGTYLFKKGHIQTLPSLELKVTMDGDTSAIKPTNDASPHRPSWLCRGISADTSADIAQLAPSVWGPVLDELNGTCPDKVTEQTAALCERSKADVRRGGGDRTVNDIKEYVNRCKDTKSWIKIGTAKISENRRSNQFPEALAAINAWTGPLGEDWAIQERKKTIQADFDARVRVDRKAGDETVDSSDLSGALALADKHQKLFSDKWYPGRIKQIKKLTDSAVSSFTKADSFRDAERVVKAMEGQFGEKWAASHRGRIEGAEKKYDVRQEKEARAAEARRKRAMAGKCKKARSAVRKYGSYSCSTWCTMTRGPRTGMGIGWDMCEDRCLKTKNLVRKCR
jgi:hypothetical protein